MPLCHSSCTWIFCPSFVVFTEVCHQLIIYFMSIFPPNQRWQWKPSGLEDSQTVTPMLFRGDAEAGNWHWSRLSFLWPKDSKYGNGIFTKIWVVWGCKHLAKCTETWVFGIHNASWHSGHHASRSSFHVTCVGRAPKIASSVRAKSLSLAAAARR